MVAEALLAELDKAVDAFLSHATSNVGQAPSPAPGATGEAAWDVKETLTHFLYYHQIAAWSIASVNAGGPPWRSPATADQMNAACVPLHSDESVADLVTQMRLAHARLRKAVIEAKDPQAVVGYRGNEEPMTLEGRLQMSANHWRGHLEALR